MKVRCTTENPLGATSKIYGSIDTNDFGSPGPKGAKIKYWGHLTNDFSYALDAVRRASRGIKYADGIYHLFDSDTNQQELDSLRLDSVYQSEILYDREKYIHNVVPIKWGGYNSNKEPIILFGFKDRSYKRKDSARVNKVSKYNLKRAIDSILKK